MKKLYIITLLVIFFSISAFAVPPLVNDNTGSDGKSGTGSFGATILTPLSIECLTTLVFLGEFVQAPTMPYNTDNSAVFENTLMDFTITGEPGHTFGITFTPSLSNPIADIKIRTNLILPSGDLDPISGLFIIPPGAFSYNDVLDPDFGTFLFTLECYEVTAKSPGEGIFEQEVTVSYNF